MFTIEEVLGKPILLEQLAEESAELTHAALKYARILRAENYTPITREEAIKNLIEEYSDVILCARILGILVDEEQIKMKNKRWASRLGI